MTVDDAQQIHHSATDLAQRYMADISLSDRMRTRRRASLPRQHIELGESYLAFSIAVRPRHPLAELTVEDVKQAGDALTIWENSEEIASIYEAPRSTKPLVEEMLLALEYVAGYPDVFGVALDSLQTRCLSLKTKIYRCLINELLNSSGASDPDPEGMLLSELADDIRENVLSTGSRDLGWYRSNMSNYLGYLDVLSQPQNSSPLVLVLKEFSNAVYLPHAPHRQAVHNLLLRWGYAADLQNVEMPEMPISLEYERAAVAKRLLSLKEAAKEGNFQAVENYLRLFQERDVTMNTTFNFAVESSVFDAITSITKFCRSKALAEPDPLVPHLRSVLEKWLAATQNPVAVQYIPSVHAPSLPSKVFSHRELRFVDETFTDRPWSKHTWDAQTDGRSWPDLLVVLEPSQRCMHAVLHDKFLPAINHENRHPFSPIKSFDLRPSQDGSTKLHTGENWFTQGTLEDTIGSSDVIYYIRHDSLSNISSSRATDMKLPPVHRLYPPSAPQTPDYWFEPDEPIGPWKKITTLAFVGIGSEITARVSSPSIISKYIFVPEDFSKFAFGWKNLDREMHRRGKVSETLVPLQNRMRPPITLEQARQLLGRTIIYRAEDELVSESRREAKRRKREAHTEPIYCAFVWGIDHPNEGALELRTFEFSQGVELGRKLSVGATRIQDDKLPSDYPAQRKVVIPDWVSLLPPPTASETAALQAEKRKEEAEALLKRFRQILQSAPALFEVGILGDRTVVIGDLLFHSPGTRGSVVVAGCKAGIWESGWRAPSERFSIWVQWIKDGHIDLTQNPEAFATKDALHPLPEDANWHSTGAVAVDGGSVAIIARGYLKPQSIKSLYGSVDFSSRDWLEMLIISGSEDHHYHIPGGVASYTGGDGMFRVDVVKDSGGLVIGIRVIAEEEDE